MAARIFKAGDDMTQRALAASQFLECSALTSMALEMRRSDPSDSYFSEKARLPAPRTFIEALIRGKRIAFACQERDGDDRVFVNSLAEQEGGAVSVAWQAAFLPGSDQITFGSDKVPEDDRFGGIWASASSTRTVSRSSGRTIQTKG